MTQEPDFTQIPLNNQRLIALDDLKAVSGYNRNLIVPDDLPPVLSLPQVQAPLKPRLVTGQEDGSVNVFLTNGTPGGRGGISVAPIPYFATFAQDPIGAPVDDNGDQRQFLLEVQGGILYALSIEFAITAWPTAAPDYVQPYFWLQSESLQDYQLPLYEHTFVKTLPAGFTQSGHAEQFIAFNPPLDLAATFPNENDVWLYSHSEGVGYKGTVTQFVGPWQSL